MTTDCPRQPKIKQTTCDFVLTGDTYNKIEMS